MFSLYKFLSVNKNHFIQKSIDNYAKNSLLAESFIVPVAEISYDRQLEVDHYCAIWRLKLFLFILVAATNSYLRALPEGVD